MTGGERRVGDYVLEGELARAGRGVVHEARSPEGVRVALTLLPDVAPAALAGFAAERPRVEQVTAGPGFVPLLDAGVEQGRAWVVTPILEGGSLRERLARGALSVEDAVEVGVALGAALGRAHARGLVHGDLRPEWVVFERPGDAEPRLAGLGLVGFGGEGARGVTLSRGVVVVGTACYAAPEQVLGGEVGPAADVFALGQVVFECVTGLPPFVGGSVEEVVGKLTSGEAPPLRARAPAAPAWLEAVLVRALARDPGARWADGEAFARALAAGERGGSAARRDRLVLAGGALALAAIGVGAWVAAAPAAREDDVVTGVLSGTGVTGSATRADGRVGGDGVAGIESVSLPPLDPALREQLDRARAEANAGHLTRAVELAEEVLAVAPDEPIALAIRGSCVIGAEADLDRAIALRPEGWMLGNRATLRARREDWSGALEAADRSLELDPPSARMLALRGEARQKLGDLAGALQDAAAAIRLDGRHAPAWRVLALVRRHQGERDHALAAMKRALALDPDYPSAEEELAGMLVEKGETEEALRRLDALLARHPDRALARGARGTALMVLARHREAAADLKRATELDPDDPVWWANLGTAHMRFAEWAQACVAADRSLALRPDHVIALRVRGLSREALGERAGALADLERVVELEPGRGTSDRALVEALTRLRER